MYHEIVLIGVAVSLLFTELTGFSPAGLIVPGYIVLCLQTPVRIVYTLVIALLAWGGGKLLGNFMILYGRRRFTKADASLTCEPIAWPTALCCDDFIGVYH